MVDQNAPMEARFAVFRYYGSFSATLLTMFEVRRGLGSYWDLGFRVWGLGGGSSSVDLFACFFVGWLVRMIRFDWL